MLMNHVDEPAQNLMYIFRETLKMMQHEMEIFKETWLVLFVVMIIRSA